MDKWKTAQEWEAKWHGNCINSFHEEQKQLVYAEKMGLVRTPTPKTPFSFDLKDKSILDIGSGPYSLLLKCVNFKNSFVTDPLMNKFPQWTKERYKEAGLFPMSIAGEDLLKHKVDKIFDEVWIYNVLEHVRDPKKIIKNARKLGKVIRIFEWLETPFHVGHPQTLTQKDLDKWLGGEGKVEIINREGTKGKCYYGVFKGDHYE